MSEHAEEFDYEPDSETVAETAAAAAAIKEVVKEIHVPKMSAAQRKLNEEDAQALVDYLRSFGEASIQVKVSRKSPKMYRGKVVEGILDTFDEPITEEDIFEQFGGGKFAVQVSKMGPTGQWAYAGQRTVKIAGDPKLGAHHDLETPTRSSDESPSVVAHAMRLTEKVAQDANERARQAEERAQRQQMQGTRGMDPAIQMLADQVRELQHSAAEERRSFLEQLERERNRKPESTIEGTMLTQMMGGESARITAIRTQVDSELRTMRERHDADIDRLNHRFDDDRRRTEDAHTRELANIRSSYESQMATMRSASDSQLMTLKISYEGQIEGLKREIIHLDRQLTTSQTELATLRGEKNKSPVDTIQEMVLLKQSMEELSGGGEEKESGGTMEKIFTAAGPLIEGVASRLASGPAAMAQPNPMLPTFQDPFEGMPVGVPVQGPDGKTYVKLPTGEVKALRKRGTKSVVTSSGEEIPDVEAGDIAMAVQFMESALQADTDPAAFATSAKSMVPNSVLTLLRTKGVDYFLNDVAKLETSSPLLTQKGKNWARKVASVLVGE